MGKLTKKQRRTLRDFITGLSGCAVIAVILITASFINRREYVPVVFSDILDGAVVTAGTDTEENSDITYDEEYLYETLFANETVIITEEETTTTGYKPDGAGGTLLINTTELTTPPETTSPTSAASTSARTVTQKPVVTTEKPVFGTTTTHKTTTQRPKTTAPIASTSKTPFTNIGGGRLTDDEKVYIKLLNLVNEARVEHGLNKLWYSARVHEVSTLRAYELSSYYSHSRSDGRGFYTAFADHGIKYKTVGENIAYGRNMFKTPEEVFEAWMNSESHRENILNPEFECAGFGLCVLKVGADTYYYWSQEFAKF